MQRIVLGLFIIGLGIFFLLELAGALDADSIIRDLWPLVLVFVGIVMVPVKEMSFLGWVITALGLIMLLRSTGIADTAVGEWLLPIFALLLGMLVLVSLGGRRSS